MYDVILFGGTTEGRLLADFLAQTQLASLLCVATPYGALPVEGRRAPAVRVGRMDAADMLALFQTERPKLVLDATHPYAQDADANIREACKKAACRYVRVLRGESEAGDCLCFADMDALTAWLNTTQGTVFSAMGAKEARALCAVENYRERLYLRLLPSARGIEECLGLGYKAKQLICMQGPFSEEFNRAQFREVRANILITKASGKEGGFSEKIRAAASLGMQVGVLRRPGQAEGLSLEEAKAWIRELCL